MQMPFGLRQQVEQIRVYAAMVAVETHSSQAKELVALLHKTADDLEITAWTVLRTEIGGNASGHGPLPVHRSENMRRCILPMPLSPVCPWRGIHALHCQ
jgi:hypothetical protein